VKAASKARRHQLKSAIYLGAGVSAVFALTPYVNKLFLTVYVLGPLAGVWFASKKLNRPLTYTDGAEIGFLSAFYGVMAASAIYDIAWHFFQEQLWRMQNAYRLLPLLAGKGQDTATPFEWYLFMFQLTIGAIVAGVIAAPAGLLGAKLFQPRPKD
jgi:hypothetical protein